VIITDPCKGCDGVGRVPRRANVKFSIPSGVDSGMTLRVREEGEAGPRGGPRGDLLVRFQVEEHENFIREGADIFYEETISFPMAALGAEVEIPTLHGPEKLNIPPGTPNHKVFRLRGKGMPATTNGNHYGDQQVRVVVEVPKKLTSRQKELLREFAAEGGETFKEGHKGFFRSLKEKFDG